MNISRIFAAAIAAFSFSSAHALDLQLKDSQFGVNHMGFAADGARACIAGDSFDPDAAKNNAQLLLVDYKRNAVLWKKRIAAPDGLFSITSRQCAFDGDNVYLLANVDTQGPRSLNQTRVYVYQFDAEGKQLGHKELSVPGRNTFGYAIGTSSSGMVVAGYSKDEDQDTESNAMFTVTLDKRLGEGKANLRKTGAFASTATARFVGDRLFIAGEFAPAKLNKQDYVVDYAQSSVVANGGYAWSVRPFKQELQRAEAGVSSKGVIYSIARKGDTSTLAVTNAEGKQLSLSTFQGKFCDTQSIAEFGNAAIAVREPCRGQGKSNELLSIEPASGKEEVLHLAPGEPVFVATNSSQWFVIAKDGSRRLSLNIGTIGAAEQAFDGEFHFKLNAAGVEHSLQVSEYKVDKKGVPSFDYVYEQRAGACRFSMSGHAVAGFEESRGKVQLEIFNPQGDDGKALPQILVYYDDTSTFTLPYKGALRQVSFDGSLTREQLKRSCGKKDSEKLSLLFKQKS